MGVTKSEIFSTEQNQLSRIAKVLGHPARIAILQHLFRIEGCVCGDLVTEIGLAQPTISQHLRELKDLGLIKGSVDGVRICYCIDQEKWASSTALLIRFLNREPREVACCGEE